MKTLRYIEGVTTLRLDVDRCVGCGACALVCPHGVFKVDEGKAHIVDLEACMECGACANNCARSAISLKPGVGCAAAIIYGWLHNTEPSCGDDGACCGTPAEKDASAGETTPGSCCGTPEAPTAADAGSSCDASPSRPEAPA